MDKQKVGPAGRARRRPFAGAVQGRDRPAGGDAGPAHLAGQGHKPAQRRRCGRDPQGVRRTHAGEDAGPGNGGRGAGTRPKARRSSPPTSRSRACSPRRRACSTWCCARVPAQRPLPSDQVRVNYQGTLLDGTVFDSSDAARRAGRVRPQPGHRRLDRRRVADAGRQPSTGSGFPASWPMARRAIPGADRAELDPGVRRRTARHPLNRDLPSAPSPAFRHCRPSLRAAAPDANPGVARMTSSDTVSPPPACSAASLAVGFGRLQADRQGRQEGRQGRARCRQRQRLAKSTGLKTEKEQASYMVGMTIGKSLEPIKDEIDVETLIKAIKTYDGGGKPLLTDEQAQQVARGVRPAPAGQEIAEPRPREKNAERRRDVPRRRTPRSRASRPPRRACSTRC